MAYYDYKAGKKRINDILSNELEIIDNNELPSIDDLTFDNAYKSWVTSVFVDIRNSTNLFVNQDEIKVSKIIRCFTSEIIEILRDSDKLREIGIRGDCVYAVYTTPQKPDVYDCVEKAIDVNTYMKMLNKLLAEQEYPQITAGIGIGTSQDLIVKAGRKGVGINNPVWIGSAVTEASNLSSIANKNNYRPIAFSDITYINIIDKLKENNSEKNVDTWFTQHTLTQLGTFYCSDIIRTQFDNWINNGMKE